MKTSYTTTLIYGQYTTKFINRNYKLKVNGYDANGKYINRLVGVAGAIALIGEELLVKFIARAEKAGLDKIVCKLRRGIRFTIYAY